MFAILKSDYFQMRELLSSKYTNIMLITYKNKKKTYIGRKIHFLQNPPTPWEIFFLPINL